MKTRILVLFCAAVMMAACCGGNSQSSSSCSKKQEGCAQTEGKACCKEAAAKADGKACCKESMEKAGEKACCAAEVKKIISARVSIKPEKVNAFVAAAKELIEKSRAEEGCISYSLYQDPQDKTKFLFFEEWKNQAAVDAHFATEHFKKFGDVLNDCASAAAVITIYDSPSEKQV